MNPLVRRSWSIRGHTPILKHRTRHHRKVSAIGAICISADRRLRWCMQFHSDSSIRQPQIIQFLRQLRRQFDGPIVVIWDHLPAHRGKQVRQWLSRRRRGIHLEYLPSYAPQLNPVEYGWGYLKMNGLANFCPLEVEALHERVVQEYSSAARQKQLIEGFIRATKLPISFLSRLGH